MVLKAGGMLIRSAAFDQLLIDGMDAGAVRKNRPPLGSESYRFTSKDPENHGVVRIERCLLAAN